MGYYQDFYVSKFFEIEYDAKVVVEALSNKVIVFIREY